MNVWALRLFRTFIPLPVTLFTLLSITFLLLGGVRRDRFLDNNYLFMINASHIRAVKTPSHISGKTAANHLGLSNFYYFYLWGHCSSNHKLENLKCSEARIDYHFNPKAMLSKELSSGAIVKLPSGTDSFTKKVRIASLCMVILYLVSALFGLLTFLAVIIVASGSGLIFASLLAAYAWFSLMAASGTMTIMYLVVKNSIRDKAGYLNVTSRHGVDVLWITWCSSALSLIVFLSLLVATGLTEKRKREAAKLYQ